MIVTKLLAVAVACAAVPYAHYSGVAAHEAMHCMHHVDGSECRVKLYRVPYAGEGGVDASTESDRLAGRWEHVAIGAVEWFVYAAFLAPAFALWSIGGKHGTIP